MEKMIGQRIRERRKSLRMSQEELSKRSNVCRVTISMLENGQCGDVLISTLSSLASALGTTVDFLCRER